jgi:hypothetical protein
MITNVLLPAAVALLTGLSLSGASTGPPGAGATRPDANVPAGATSLPRSVGAEPTACTRYVSTAPNASNDNPGTFDQPWKSVGKAVATLTAGQVGCVASGAYEEAGSKAANNGDMDRPIVLKRAPGSATRPIVKLTGTSALLELNRRYWVIDGLDFNLNHQRVTGVIVGPEAQRIVVRNSAIHEDARGAALYVAGKDVSIENNDIYNNIRYGGGDSHGVNIVTPAARVLVARNRIHDQSGDGVQCEYGALDANTPTDITIRDNEIYNSPGVGEQAVDIKACLRVTVGGSTAPDRNDPNAAGQRFYGFQNRRNADGSWSGNGGGAVVIHIGARNVLVENNRMYDSCNGMNIGQASADNVVQNVVVRRNAIYRINGEGAGCHGHGLIVQRIKNMDLYHNSFVGIQKHGVRLGVNNSIAITDDNIDFFNNIVQDAAPFVEFDTTKLRGFASDRNIYWSSTSNQKRFRIKYRNDVSAKDLTLAEWQNLADVPADHVLLRDPSSVNRDPLFIPDAGRGDYYTRPNSPARDTALPNTGAKFSGCGPDIGFRETYD